MGAKFIQINSNLLKLLSNSTYRVFCILVNHSNSKHECYPSIRTIAKEYNLSPKTVQTAIDKLVDLKIVVKKTRTTGDGKITSNLYTINREYIVEKKSNKRVVSLPSWFNKTIEKEKPPIHELETLKEELKRYGG